MLRLIFAKKIVIVIAVGVAVYFLIFPYREQTQKWSAPFLTKVKQFINPQTIDSTTTQIKTLAERGTSLASESGELLDNVVGVNQSEATKSMTERTIDYAQYRYCKQVVDEWDRRSANPTGDK